MGRIGNAFELVKASWAMIRKDKELLALPVMSGLASLLTVALFAIPILALLDIDFSSTADDAAAVGSDAATNEFPLVTYALLAAMYLLLAFITVFFNSALVHGANERMSGGDPTIGSALGGAVSRLNRIGPWAIVSATVSFVIRQIQERFGILGAILGFLGGLAWAAVTFLVLPILVIENIGVFDAVKRSAGLLRTAWGEGLAGHIGLGIVGFLASIPFVVIAVIGVLSGSVAVAVPAVVVGVLGLLTVAVVMSALSVVYQTALYRFAVGQPVDTFSDHLMQDAFYPKRSGFFSR